jgi:murein L,D-transpeptidase YcbB/YkuD
MRRLTLIFCLLLLLAATTHAADITDSEARVADALGKLLMASPGQPEDATDALPSLYQQRNFTPLWYRQDQPTQQALTLLGLLRDAASYGLHADDYEGIKLSYQLTAQTASDISPVQLVQSRAQFDLTLSAATLRLLRHLHYGRIDPRKAGFDLTPARGREFDAAAILTTLAKSSDPASEIGKLEPQFLHYRLLKAALTRYRLLAVDAELTQLPTFPDKSIKPGQPYVGAAALRRLLLAERDLAAAEVAPDSDTTLDPALVSALQRYQQRHGLQVDGGLGKQTFAALTTPFTARVRQIELTLERWRWLPPLQSPMIVVNIPQFKLFAFQSADDRETNLLRMDVIVGQAFPHTRTPVFLADMKYVVLRPYWDVPGSITQRELLPSLHRDANYFQRNHFELVRGQGDNSPVVAVTPENLALTAMGEVRVRQLPGADNALGDVKFMFPNNYNVYLHSTPVQRLFSASQRAFSHGCVRVSNPLALAEYVLRNTDEAWSKEKIQTAMQGEANQRVYLNRPIPVMIVYGTVMANEAGQVQFFADIYGYDQKLARLL